jgi:hypothetical protein
MTIHIEQDGAEVVFWVESPDQPHYTAAADSMAELKALCRESCEIEGWPPPSFTLDPDPVGALFFKITDRRDSDA